MPPETYEVVLFGPGDDGEPTAQEWGEDGAGCAAETHREGPRAADSTSVPGSCAGVGPRSTTPTTARRVLTALAGPLRTGHTCRLRGGRTRGRFTFISPSP